MECIVALQGKILEKRRRCIHPVRRVVKVAAKNGLGGPVGLAVFALGIEVLHQLADLAETVGSRAIVQMEVHDGQEVPAGVDLGVQETLFADLVLPNVTFSHVTMGWRDRIALP